MLDIAVKAGASWVCPAQGRHLADVLLPVHIRPGHDWADELVQSQGRGDAAVMLEQTQDGSPCILTIHCSSSSSAAISRLLVVSEARTLELYNQAGEYCRTVRGQRDHSVQHDSEDRGPFYSKQLILEQPSSACDVKLLSLAGRSSVLVCRVVVGLQPLQACPPRAPGIDMQQVQCLVEEMGKSLSPGAQNLMDMVHFQQKNQTGSLGGFLPLLMGSGAFSALAPAANTSDQSAESTVSSPGSLMSPADESPLAENGAMSGSSTTCSPDSLPSGENTNSSVSSDSRGPVNHAHLAEMMSRFLKGDNRQVLKSSPELLPVLQSVCGQVTQLRLDDAAAEKENGSWALDSAMERRLEEMERRLKEHVDRRLDALEQKLEKVLLRALPLATFNQGALNSSAGGASTGPLEQNAPTPATQ